MKRTIAFGFLLLLLFSFFAYAEKTFEDLDREYDQLMDKISECNKIISACQEYLDIKAETHLDTPELKSARAKLQLLDVIPYKKYAPEISYVESALEIENMKLEMYMEEAKTNLLQQAECLAKAAEEIDTSVEE